MAEINLVQLLIQDFEILSNLIKSIDKERSKNNKVFTERQFFVMIKIYKYKKIELKNLSKELNVSTSSLCILLNKMVEQGYVYRKEDSRDRRNTFYGITDFGEDTINIEMKKISSIIEKKFDILEEEDKKIMIESLKNIKNIAKKYILTN